MSLLQVSRATLRRAARGTPQTVPRRGLATAEPEVSWSEYRSGNKTFAEWVDANRHVVAGGMFAFYVSLAVWKFGPWGKKEVEETLKAPMGEIPTAAEAADAMGVKGATEATEKPVDMPAAAKAVGVVGATEATEKTGGVPGIKAAADGK